MMIGTGLGLALVKHLVGLHGGDVHVYSRENVGSRFFFTLLFDTIAGDSLPRWGGRRKEERMG